LEFDMIFIDGEHTYRAVLGDFKLSYPMLMSGGIIAFHDSTKPEIRQAINEVCKELGLKLHTLDNFITWVEKQ
jgi:predicted O-methyltransferase YrrM